jgi:hypothetical protein
MGGLVPIGDKTFTNPTPKLSVTAKAVRRNATHVRISVDAGRQATVAFSGVCSGAGGPTSEDGRKNVTVRHTRRGSCRVMVTRENWAPASKSWKLRAPR